MRKILVVDDSPTARAFIVDTLSGKGYHILTAVDG
jgi:CheY-like chemotaxis protein